MQWVLGYDCRPLQEAAKVSELMKNENEVEVVLQKILHIEGSPVKLAEFFALLLVWHDIGDARDLWINSWHSSGVAH